MESALIVSSSEKGSAFFSEILNVASIGQIAVMKSCSEARRLLMERDFDLVVVNAPLSDESGESLSRYISSKYMSQVILAVKSEYFDAASAACEGDGVLTVSKPLNRAVFWSALSLARSAQSKIKRVQAENTQLKQRIEDIKTIDRAKCILISNFSMSENEAHRHIEKQAMDKRIPKKEAAKEIIGEFSF